MIPYLGNAGFSWDDGVSTLRLRTPLRDFRIRHQRKRFSRESMDYSVREVTNIGTGVNEVRATLRFEDNAGGVMDLLREGADGNLLHYHHRNWVRYSEMDTDSDGNGRVDGWTPNAGTGTVTFVADDSAQKITVSGAGATTIYTVTQIVYGVTAGEAWVLSSYLRGSGLSAGMLGTLAIVWQDGGGITLLADQVSFTLGASYARQSIARTAPANATRAVLTIGLLSGASPGGSGSVWIRDSQFEIASVASAYLPSYPCYQIEPSGDTLETELDADRGMMGDQAAEMVLRSASSLDFRLLVTPGT